ncbi:MAG: YdcF family protein [Paracoccaceae bacterium]|nr:YdcF family protein [Paracoccaceae bacterium]
MIYLHKLLPLLVSPLAIILYFLLISFFTKSRWPSICAIISVIIFSNPIVAQFGKTYLEKDYPVIELKNIPKVDSIVVLSGMIRNIEKTNGEIDYEFSEAVDRFEAGISLMELGKSTSIIFTRGWLAWSVGMPEGEYLRSLAVARGINTNNISLTPEVKNTDEEAEAIFRLLGSNNTIALVTSAFHMPRAIKVFEQRNFNIVPIAVDRRAGVSKLTFLDFLPSGNAIAENSLFFREIIGRVYYALIY